MICAVCPDNFCIRPGICNWFTSAKPITNHDYPGPGRFQRCYFFGFGRLVILLAASFSTLCFATSSWRSDSNSSAAASNCFMATSRRPRGLIAEAASTNTSFSIVASMPKSFDAQARIRLVSSNGRMTFRSDEATTACLSSSAVQPFDAHSASKLNRLLVSRHRPSISRWLRFR